MGRYNPIDNKQGFVILNRWGTIWTNTLYHSEKSARETLVAKGFAPDGENFKIVSAHFELDTAEIVPEKV